MISRINAHFRRNEKREEIKAIQSGELKIDISAYTVTAKGKNHNLPKKEFELLHFLAKRPGCVFDRSTLIRNIWETDVYVLDLTVDVHVRKVREKIGEGYILTILGLLISVNISTQELGLIAVSVFIFGFLVVTLLLEFLFFRHS